MSEDPLEKPRNILPDCIIPALALGFTAYYLSTITEVPWISQASAVVVSGLLSLAILAFVVRSAWRLKRGEEVIRLRESMHGLLGYIPTSARRVALLALAVGYVWSIDSLGFTLTTFLFLFAAIVLLSSVGNWKRALIVSLTSSAIGYIVFLHLFKTRFPTVPIEIWLEKLF